MSALTVTMPVYNAMPYLPAAVESILGQSFRDFEFLIIDDGSTDGSGEYLESIRDPRIRLYREQRRGQTPTRNRLLELTRTDLCALMDADDIAMPERLQLQRAFMRNHPEVVLVGTQVNHLTGSRTISAPRVPMTHKGIVTELLSGRAAVCHPTCMVRSEAVRAVGGYRLTYSEEHDLFLRLSECGALANLSEQLLTYRMHLGSTFVTQLPLHLAYRGYSIACYRARQSGAQEPELAEFLDAWEQCGWLEALGRWLDHWSAVQYRCALVKLGQGRRLAGIARMTSAAVCRPRASLRQMASRVRRRISRPLL
jgi:glycosyltransferase involved in cell wall biosynthesis